MTRSALCRTARRRLDCSQSQLASMLGVSAKAVESYEQGWRRTPDRVLIQMLSLLQMARDAKDIPPPCWEQVQCPPALRTECRSRTLGHGHYCWQVASPACRRNRKGDDPGLDSCLICPVVQSLLQPPHPL